MQKCILIVEDNALNMQLFNDLLEAHGYKPLPSRSGVEALELAPTQTRSHSDGYSVARRFRTSGHAIGGEHLRHIPVIAITGFAMKGTRKKSGRADADPILRNHFPSRHSSKLCAIISTSHSRANLFSNAAISYQRKWRNSSSVKLALATKVACRFRDCAGSYGCLSGG